ncbi:MULTISPECIES: hypothetical protein [Kosakonia]|nr:MULTISPECIES: hypothetical protein [Kosakonia]MDD7996487.1 hypothetical protein [Kosakonia radicincitans]MDP9566096.1 hypothetical protein [Kosakonia oryzae]VVT46372.1 hypothetical protein UYSO10_0873 [Kosakonia radicincitans]
MPEFHAEMLFCDIGIHAPGSEQGNLNGTDEKNKPFAPGVQAKVW